MNIQEKLGAIYAKLDCNGRNCDNCIVYGCCNIVDVRELIREVQAEVRELCKTKEVANEKEG